MLDTNNLRVKDISQADPRTLEIVWTDGKSQKFDVVSLRRQCPCASCIDEWTGKKRLREGEVSDDVRPMTVDSVGRYALKIAFSDGHSTGIYTFKMLRELN